MELAAMNVQDTATAAQISPHA